MDKVIIPTSEVPLAEQQRRVKRHAHQPGGGPVNKERLDTEAAKQDGNGRALSTGSARALIFYPVPLRDATAFLKLPFDLKLAEAERIFRVMKSVCVDSPNERLRNGGLA